MKRCVAVYSLALLLLICSCGLFSSRPSEHPSNTTPQNSDPLNFLELTASTQYQFTKLQYEDLFQGPDPIYFDNNSGTSTASQLIQRLRQIVTADPNVEVTWSNTIITTTSSPDTIIIPQAKYYVTYHYVDTIRGGITVYDSGSSLFKIAHDASWHITYWKDVPAPAMTGPSFFSPNFAH